MAHSRLICLVSNNSTPQDLILDGVHAAVEIVDVHAQVVMNQRFTNPFDQAVEATYSFGMLADAAICGFEMVRGDETKVVGKVMEKKAAREAYEQAVAAGKTAGLGEEQTKDVFTIKVGNILANETVTINLTFLSPLIDDEKRDQVRFTFPRGYAFRYGEPPTIEAANAFPTAGTSQNFSIEVAIQQASPITSVSCPSSHPIELSLGHLEGAAIDSSIPESHFASVKLTSPSPYLTQDFVLVVTAAGLDSPRCFIEPHPSPDENTTALGLTFVPRFNIPDVQTGMEYIFIVDRSGSMEGTPIALVREALVVLLRGLPTHSTTFNIISFGSTAGSLWSSSKDYTQASMNEATRYIDTMEANYGGTEIADALKLTFESLPKQRKRPVSIFLLTDGGAWDISPCVGLTTEALKSPGEFIRVFTIGIGTGVSTDTVESIARAGEGMSIYVQPNEPMTGKLARLVRASRTSAIKDVEVLWPEGGSEVIRDIRSEDMLPASEPESNSVSNKGIEKIEGKDYGPPPQPEIKPENITPPPIQQSPLTIFGLFPGTRTRIYAIISSIQDQLPSSVKVRGKVATTGDVVELEVMVTKIMSTRKALIHTFAARSIITDREDGEHTSRPQTAAKCSVLAAHNEADIIRLGIKYGLASRHTSYVAIDEREQDERLKFIADTRYPSAEGEPVFGSRTRSRAGTIDPMAMKDSALLEGGISTKRSKGIPLPSLPSFGFLRMPFSRLKPKVLSKRPTSASQSSSLVSSPQVRAKDVGESTRTGISAVARLQNFDGSFASHPRLFRALEISEDDVKQKFSNTGVSKDVLATVLAVMWMWKHAEEEAQDMVDKAEEWLNASVGGVALLEELKMKATELL